VSLLSSAQTSLDIKSTISKNRLLGLWRLMRGFRLHYVTATLALGISATSKTLTYLLLRYFIDDLDQMLTVDSRLRLEINRRFKAAGIVVAFPQRDIRLDTSQPLEVRVVESGPAV